MIFATFLFLASADLQVETPAPRATFQDACSNAGSVSDWRRAASAGDAQSALNLSSFYGFCVRDSRVSREWLVIAEQNGSAEAARLLWSEDLIEGQAASTRRGLALLQKWAKRGDSAALMAQGVRKILGNGLPKDVDGGILMLEKLGLDGEPRAPIEIVRALEPDNARGLYLEKALAWALAAQATPENRSGHDLSYLLARAEVVAQELSDQGRITAEEDSAAIVKVLVQAQQTGGASQKRADQ